jgi:hypothetical protein
MQFLLLRIELANMPTVQCRMAPMRACMSEAVTAFFAPVTAASGA